MIYETFLGVDVGGAGRAMGLPLQPVQHKATAVCGKVSFLPCCWPAAWAKASKIYNGIVEGT